MSLYGTGPRRETFWRWPVAWAGSLLISLAIAVVFARIYPTGRLDAPGPRPLRFIVLSPPPEIEVEDPATEPRAEEAEPPPRPPDPRPDPLASGFEALLLEQVDALWDADPGAPIQVVLTPPPADLRRLALLDTTYSLIPPASHLLFAGSWQAARTRLPMLIHMDKAMRFKANERSIFNEDWLEGEVLK